MGSRVHYPEEIKWKVVELKEKGYSNQTIIEIVRIKNMSQIKTWIKWYRTGQTHRFSQPVGKQYTYGKGVEGLIAKLYKYGARSSPSLLYVHVFPPSRLSA
ncbi:hypothetical protein FZC66_08060 [Priestia megaterium]|nr:hypothetical protein FZC66_08060 [Priestia megaterium]